MKLHAKFNMSQSGSAPPSPEPTNNNRENDQDQMWDYATPQHGVRQQATVQTPDLIVSPPLTSAPLRKRHAHEGFESRVSKRLELAPHEQQGYHGQGQGQGHHQHEHHPHQYDSHGYGQHWSHGQQHQQHQHTVHGDDWGVPGAVWVNNHLQQASGSGYQQQHHHTHHHASSSTYPPVTPPAQAAMLDVPVLTMPIMTPAMTSNYNQNGHPPMESIPEHGPLGGSGKGQVSRLPSLPPPPGLVRPACISDVNMNNSQQHHHQQQQYQQQANVQMQSSSYHASSAAYNNNYNSANASIPSGSNGHGGYAAQSYHMDPSMQHQYYTAPTSAAAAAPCAAASSSTGAVSSSGSTSLGSGGSSSCLTQDVQAREHEGNYKATAESGDSDIDHFSPLLGDLLCTYSLNGKRVGRYEIVAVFGEGTFGKAFLCKDHKCGQAIVAVKVIRDVAKYRNDARLEAEILDAVKCEAKRRGCGDNFGVVEFLGAFMHKGLYCMVFEPLGPSLLDFLTMNCDQPAAIYDIQHIARDVIFVT